MTTETAAKEAAEPSESAESAEVERDGDDSAGSGRRVAREVEAAVALSGRVLHSADIGVGPAQVVVLHKEDRQRKVIDGRRARLTMTVKQVMPLATCVWKGFVYLEPL